MFVFHPSTSWSCVVGRGGWQVQVVTSALISAMDPASQLASIGGQLFVIVEFCKERHSSTCLGQREFPRAIIVRRSVRREFVGQSKKDLRKNDQADHCIGRFAAANCLFYWWESMLGQYGQGVMCRQSWATSCHVEKPALRWLLLIMC